MITNFMDLKKLLRGEGMPTNFMDLKKLLRGVGYAQIFHRLENCWSGGVPTNFMDLKKMLVGGGGGGYAKIFYAFEKNVGGGGIMPKYFMDLKKC